MEELAPKSKSYIRIVRQLNAAAEAAGLDRTLDLTQADLEAYAVDRKWSPTTLANALRVGSAHKLAMSALAPPPKPVATEVGYTKLVTLPMVPNPDPAELRGCALALFAWHWPGSADALSHVPDPEDPDNDEKRLPRTFAHLTDLDPRPMLAIAASPQMKAWHKRLQADYPNFPKWELPVLGRLDAPRPMQPRSVRHAFAQHAFQRGAPKVTLDEYRLAAIDAGHRPVDRVNRTRHTTV